MSKSMSCNIESGICEVNLDVDLENYVYKKPVLKGKVLMEYYTDPLCSACFAFDPVIEQILESFENRIEFKIILGGMVKKEMSTKEELEIRASNTESMGEMFNVPMSGKLLKESPVDSSYPPSLAYLAVLKQDETKGLLFMRKLREAIYVLDKDISKEKVLVELVEEIGLDVDVFIQDFYSPALLDELEEHIAYTIMNGVSGFPSVVIHDLSGQSMIIRGINDFYVFKDALLKLGVFENVKKEYTLESALSSDYYMNLREIADKLNVYFAEDLEKELKDSERVEVINVSYGHYYKLKKAV